MRALFNSTGHRNTALGFNAGLNATNGSDNLFLGAEVQGTAADTNTIRIGVPFDGALGQNKTFIAGIYGTQLTGAATPVFIDANGQLGILQAIGGGGGGGISPPPSGAAMAQRQQLVALQQQVKDQEAAMTELRARVAKLEALLTLKK